MPQNSTRKRTVGVDWRRSLSRHLHGRVVVVALGDRSTGDDAAGPLLIDLLQGKTDLLLLDVGSYPQNYMGVIARQNPDTVVFADGAELGLPPGSIRYLGVRDVTDLGGGSHGFPLTMLMDQIARMAQAEVFLLAIQVASLSRGAGLSRSVADAVDEIARFVSAVRPGTAHPGKN
jgi:hydrogenase maturation protease